MKQSNKYIFLACALAMLCSCVDKSYYGVFEISADKQTREPVVVLLGSTGYLFDTKGQGMADGRAAFAEMDPDVYVYGFKHGLPFTSIPGTKGDDCLIDRSLDEAAHRGGKKGTISYPDYCITWRDGNPDKPVRYPLGTDEYDFYVYYTGGVDIPSENYSRTENNVSCSFDIDGSMDLMSGCCITDMLDHKYSNYSAKYGIAPAVTLEHHLANIIIEMYPFEKGCHTVTIREVKATNMKCGATFTVVDQNPKNLGVTFSDKRQDFILKEPDGKDLDREKYHTSKDADFTKVWYLRESVKVGGSFLIPPSNEALNLKINLWDSNLDNYEGLVDPEGINVSMKLDPPQGGFQAGNSYILRLKVKNQSPVIIDPEVDPWK